MLFLTGYRGEKLERFLAKQDQQYLEIQISRGDVEWDTGRRLWEVRGKLDATFILMYSDNIVPSNLDKLAAFQKENASAITATASPKSPGNLGIAESG